MKKLWIIVGLISILCIGFAAATIIDIGGRRITLPTFPNPVFSPPDKDGKIITPPPIDKGKTTTTTTTLPPYNVDEQIKALQQQVDDLKKSNDLLQGSLTLLNSNLDSANSEIQKLTDTNKQMTEQLCAVNKEYKFCSAATLR